MSVERPSVDVDEVRAHVEAPPAAVWALVADVLRTPEWSPVCRRVEWLAPSDHAEVGARFRGHNRRNGFRWSRECVVDVCEPGRELAFHTRFRGEESTRWRYTFTVGDDGRGCDLVEHYEAVLLPRWIRVLRRMPGALQTTRRQAHDNIETSVERIKVIAEREVGPTGPAGDAGGQSDDGG